MNKTYALTFSPIDSRRINARQNDSNKFILLSVCGQDLRRAAFPLPRGELTLVELFAFAQAKGFAIFQIPNY